MKNTFMRVAEASATARRMTDAAAGFLKAIAAEQRDVSNIATIPFDSFDRFAWNYFAVPRKGLMIKHMTPSQREAALELLDSGLSDRGSEQARSIIANETVLDEYERIEGIHSRWVRDPAGYYFCIFGKPDGIEPWGWRASGHHLNVHCTVVKGELVSATPLFFGAYPAEIRQGPEKGTRILPEEEDTARSLLGSLEGEARQIAIVDPTAPADLITGTRRFVGPSLVPAGLAYHDMSAAQQELLERLIRVYVGRAAHEVAEGQWKTIESAGLDSITFAWAGPDQRGQGHYYAVQGPTFLIEYNNTQHDSNHMHSVWRDFTNDWGEDILARHYLNSHRDL